MDARDPGRSCAGRWNGREGGTIAVKPAGGLLVGAAGGGDGRVWLGVA